MACPPRSSVTFGSRGCWSNSSSAAESPSLEARIIFRSSSPSDGQYSSFTSCSITHPAAKTWSFRISEPSSQKSRCLNRLISTCAATFASQPWKFFLRNHQQEEMRRAHPMPANAPPLLPKETVQTVLLRIIWLYLFVCGCINLIHQTQKRQKPQTPFRGQRQESYRNIVYSGFAKSYLTYEQLQAYSKTLSGPLVSGCFQLPLLIYSLKRK